jgi:hypothetical protein
MEIMKAEDLRKMMEDKFNNEDIKKMALEHTAERIMSNIKFIAENRAKYSYLFDIENHIKYLDMNTYNDNNVSKILLYLQFITNCYEIGDKDEYLNFTSKLQQIFIDAGYAIIQKNNMYKFTINWKKNNIEE